MRALWYCLAVIVFAQAPKPAALVRAEQVREQLITQKILDGRLLRWAGATYTLAPDWQICESFSGLCFFGSAEGQREQVVLAAYETSSGDIAIEQLVLKSYHKSRSQEAVHYFIARGATLNNVFKLADPDGKPLFTERGLLTQAGDVTYEQLQRGLTPKSTAPEKPRKQAPPEQDPKKTAAEIAKLKRAGFMELDPDENDCVHKVFKQHSDEELGIVTVVHKRVPRTFMRDDDNDPAVVIVKQYRKNQFCGNSSIKPR